MRVCMCGESSLKLSKSGILGDDTSATRSFLCMYGMCVCVCVCVERELSKRGISGDDTLVTRSFLCVCVFVCVFSPIAFTHAHKRKRDRYSTHTHTHISLTCSFSHAHMGPVTQVTPPRPQTPCEHESQTRCHGCCLWMCHSQVCLYVQAGWQKASFALTRPIYHRCRSSFCSGLLLLMLSGVFRVLFGVFQAC